MWRASRPRRLAIGPCSAGLATFGAVALVGVEGTGGLGPDSPPPAIHQVAVVEVGGSSRPRQHRRRREIRTPTTPWPRPGPLKEEMPPDRPRTRDGNVEAMRVLRVARRSAGRPDPGPQPDAQPDLDRARRAAGRAAGPLHLQGPDPKRLAARQDRRDRLGGGADLRTLARRAISLEGEVKEIDRLLKVLVAETAPGAQRRRRGAPMWHPPSWWPPVTTRSA